MIHQNNRMRIVAVATLALSLRVLGQTPAETENRQNLLEEAQKARDADDHARALSLASRAGHIRMTPSVRLFIAEEQSAVGQLANSMNNAELCAREATDDKALKNREKIVSACKSLVAKLQKSAARLLVLMPDPVPPRSQVMVNGHLLPEALYGKPYLLSPGNVRVEANAPGRAPFNRELAVAPGEEGTVTVLLPAEVAATPPAQPPPPVTREPPVVSATPEQEKSKFREIGPYVVLGTGAASLGASLIFLVLRNSAVNDLDAKCGGPNHTVCPDTPDVRSLKNKASTDNTLTNVTLGIGAAAVIGGGAWLFWEETHPSKKSSQARLQITPTSGGAMVGIAGVL